ncbi:hypothetical protein [Streptomyces albofaciens]|uniref:hypothetical protein n=1 Tax=Streptomyces albofaciens TaxID=66866 RepID=UPI001AD7905E|nr:hypothetical protein [Streptomyces albofaciens]
MDLVYTTAGGVVGAAVTAHISRNHERRQLRATVMERLQQVSLVRAGVWDIVPCRHGRPAASVAGRQLSATAELGLSAVLEDGGDAERALREAVAGLVVASLSAGIPRRVLDFAGGGEERALQCEVIRLADLRVGGVLGESLDELMTACAEYREATAQLLLQALWHPWQSRWRMSARIRALRTAVEALHHRQEAALSLLARPPHARTLARRLIGALPPDTEEPGSAGS